MTLKMLVDHMGGPERLGADAGPILAVYGQTETTGWRLASDRDEDGGRGRLSLRCLGGEVLLTAEPVNALGRVLFVILWDDTAGAAWLASLLRDPFALPHDPRPYAGLRLAVLT